MTDMVDLGGSVLAFAPTDDSRAMTVARGHLAVCRDLAAREIGRPLLHGECSITLLLLVVDIVTGIIFARASVDQLTMALRLSRRLLQCATELNQYEAATTP